MLIILLYLNQILFDKFIPKNSDIKPYWMINKSGENYDYVILGSSRTLSGIDPEILEKCNYNYTNGINASMDGTNYPELYLILKFMLENNKIHDVILLADVYSFDNSFFSLPFHPYYYFPFMEKKEFASDVLKNMEPEKYNLWKLIPFYKYAEYNEQIGMKQFLASIFTNDRGFINDMNKGFFINNGFITDELLMSVDNYYPKKNIIVDTLNGYYFDRIIKESLENNIRVFLVNVPEYHRIYEQQLNRNEVISYLEQKANKFSIPFYNMEEDSICYERKYFANFTHLNYSGTRYYTEKLAQYISKNDIK